MRISDWSSDVCSSDLPHRHYRARQLLAAYPFVDREKLLGGFRYGDCQEDDARMTLTVVAAGQRAGVVCANRVAATRFIEADGEVCGAEVEDRVRDRKSTRLNSSH